MGAITLAVAVLGGGLIAAIEGDPASKKSADRVEFLIERLQRPITLDQPNPFVAFGAVAEHLEELVNGKESKRGVPAVRILIDTNGFRRIKGVYFRAEDESVSLPKITDCPL